MSTTKKQLKKIEQSLFIEEPRKYFVLNCREENGGRTCREPSNDKIYNNEEEFKKEKQIAEKDILMVINYKVPEGA